MSFTKGATVRLIQPVIQGEVVGATIDETTLDRRFLVRWTNAEGDTVERYFTEAELEAVEPPAE